MIKNIDNIQEFFNRFLNEKTTIQLLELVHEQDSEQVFKLCDNLWVNAENQPTVVTNGTQVVLSMHITHSHYYLNNQCLKKIENFKTNFDRYLKLYNEIQEKYKVKFIDMYLSIEYNIISKDYTIDICYKKNIFCPYQESYGSQFAYIHLMRSLMRVDPNDYMMSDYIIKNSKLLLKENVNKYPNIEIIPDNSNIVDSNDNKKINNMFTITEGLYQPSDIFKAIQSYLDLTDNDYCNILTPSLIEDQYHLNKLIQLKNMAAI